MIFFLVFSGPNFSKLAWIVLLKILMHLKYLNAEFWILDDVRFLSWFKFFEVPCNDYIYYIS